MHRRSQQFASTWVRISLAALLALVLTGCQHRQAHGRAESFAFVQMCDPQIGFGDYTNDLRRFDQAVRQINALQPDLVVVCGDLVNSANEKSFADFNAARARFTIPSHVAPGNHDVGNEPTPQTLERYRRLIGKDFYSFEHKGSRFVIINSQLWKTPVPGETETHDTWLKQTLESARAASQPVFIIMHHPVFLIEPSEADNYFNLAQAKRQEVLDLFDRSGVVAVLMGHTHTSFKIEYRGIQMVCSETTSRNFDERPYGFRVWHVAPQRPYRHDFVPLD